jgi:phage recombination protein Bet
MSEKSIQKAPTRALALPLEFTPEQRAMIRNSFANGANDREFEVLMAVASLRRLNPLLKQIYFVKRYDSMKRCDVWATQVSIDGLRAIAERTGLYAGQDEPVFVEDDKSIKACKVSVYRKDWPRPAVGVAYWSEYVQTTKEGKVTMMWREKGHVMISKCAEAIALRKAFPEDMSGLYAHEEFGRADVEVESVAEIVEPPAHAPQSRPDAVAGDTAVPQVIHDDIAQHPGDSILPMDVAAAIYVDHLVDLSQEQQAATFRHLVHCTESTAADLKRAVAAEQWARDVRAAKSVDELKEIYTEACKEIDTNKALWGKAAKDVAIHRLKEMCGAKRRRLEQPDPPSGGGSPKPNGQHTATQDPERDAIQAEHEPVPEDTSQAAVAQAPELTPHAALKAKLAECENVHHLYNALWKYAQGVIPRDEAFRIGAERMAELGADPMVALSALREEAKRRGWKSVRRAA